MKKAKIILTAITVLVVVGGALAFKAAEFNGFPLFTLGPTTTISSTINGCVYTTTTRSCVPSGAFATDIGPIITTRFTAPGQVIARCGTATTLIQIVVCPTFSTRGTFDD